MEDTTTFAAGGFLFFLCFGLITILSLLLTAFWIWMLVDCAINEPNDGNEKVVWIIVIVLTQALGALLYFLIRRPKRMQDYGK